MHSTPRINRPSERRAESAGALYYPTDISPSKSSTDRATPQAARNELTGSSVLAETKEHMELEPNEDIEAECEDDDPAEHDGPF